MSGRPPLPRGPPPGGSSYRPARNLHFNDRDNYDRRDDNRDYRAPMYEFGSNNVSDRRQGNLRSSDDRYHRRPSPRNYDNSRYDSYAPGGGHAGDAPPNLRTSANVYPPTYSQQHYNRGPPPGTGSEFSFRAEAPPSISQNTSQLYRPNSPPRHHQGGQGRSRGRENNGDTQRRGAGRGRGGYQKPLASDRAFLKGNREPTPDMMPGMDDEAAGVRFKPLDDVSDSDEAEMEFSEDERGADQPNKRRKIAGGDAASQWSNPDPYTALPPPDESQRKKKDVVKLIRKARVDTVSGSNAEAGGDFISFEFGDEEDPLQARSPTPDPIVEAAPNAPRFSHAAKLQRQPAPPPAQLGNYQVHGLPPTHLFTLPKPTKLDTMSDPALGSRKRGIDDEIKDAPLLHKINKKGNKIPPANGNILAEWKPKAGSPKVPWNTMDHSETENLGLWLHKEIYDFYDFVKPREFENIIRTRLVEDLRQKLKQTLEYQASGIHTFGSFPAGLYLPTADMDLVLISDHYTQTGKSWLAQNKSFFFRFEKFLKKHDLAVSGSIELIINAKVPLVKYIDKLTGLKVDISFENTTGLTANRTFQDWKTQFPAMPIIVTLIKHLLAMRGLNEPVNGGIGGFSVTCLVVSLLQLMPQVQSRSMVPEHHLNEILMEFLALYGADFHYDKNAITLNPPGYMSKANTRMPYNKNRGAPRLSIIDPNNPDNDIAGGSSNVEVVLDCFNHAFNDLTTRMSSLKNTYPTNRRNASILEVIFAGNYSTFKKQREHLAYLHEKLYGPLLNGGA